MQTSHQFVISQNLAADHRGVGDKILVDSVLGGNGEPTSPPPVAEKIWPWWDTSNNRISHMWSPVLNRWVALGFSDCCEQLQAQIDLLKAEIEALKSTSSTTPPSPSDNLNCWLEFPNWDLSNGEGDARLRAVDGRTTILTLEPRNGARIDWKGNNSAQRDIPLSQEHEPAIAGASTFRAQFTWDTSPEKIGDSASFDSGDILCTIKLSSQVENPAFYVENLGQAAWDGSRNIAYSAQLEFVNSEQIQKLSGPAHLMIQGRSVWREVGVSAQDLGRSTDDNSGEAAGWLKIVGTFGPDKPIQFIISPAPGSSEGRGQDAIAFTIPFLTCE